MNDRDTEAYSKYSKGCKLLDFIAIVFKSISNRNLWMIARNATLAVVLALSFALDTKAEDIKTDESIQVSCNPFTSNDITAQCNSNLNVEPEQDLIAQRRGRKRKSKVDGYYGGFSIGIGFGSGEIDLGEGAEDFTNPEYSTSFVGSFFEGIKFNKNLSADLEFLLVFGGADSDALDNEFNEFARQNNTEANFETDSSYSTFALYFNPRFELPLSESGSFNLYVSPGIGLSQTNVSFEFTSDIPDVEDEKTDASDTGITFQIKGGASIAITETIQAFAQARYLTLPTDEGFDSINIFGTDAGLKFNF
jgi:opacity protein-like surface antigen